MTVNSVEEKILAAARFKLNVDSKVSILCLILSIQQREVIDNTLNQVRVKIVDKAQC